METIRSRYFNWTIVIVSLAIPAVVAALLYLPVAVRAGAWVRMLPHLNAVLNTATAFVLIAGYVFIRNKKQEAHKRSMLVAFALGTLFLASYLIYHSSVPSTAFGNSGTLRYVYFALLISHILLAMGVVPLVLLALYHALRKDFTRHRKIVKYAYPVWLYVSISGVIVYLMISPYYA